MSGAVEFHRRATHPEYFQLRVLIRVLLESSPNCRSERGRSETLQSEAATYKLSMGWEVTMRFSVDSRCVVFQ